MIDNAREPVVALANAQLWLRQLTEAQESAYLAAYPSLEAELQRRSPASLWAQGRGNRIRAWGPESIRPYEHPDYWVALIAVGA